MEEKNYAKYDIRRAYASAVADINEAELEDITVDITTTKDKKRKLRVSVGFGAEDGWQDVETYWAAKLPTDEDLADLGRKKIVDVLLQRGWNEETKQWGKTKVVKFITADGEEIVLNGEKDAPSESKSKSKSKSQDD